jgi:hypothetical protein
MEGMRGDLSGSLGAREGGGEGRTFPLGDFARRLGSGHLMREAIRGHQRSSEVIRCNQMQSDAIRGHQRQSEAIKTQSEVILSSAT